MKERGKFTADAFSENSSPRLPARDAADPGRATPGAKPEETSPERKIGIRVDTY